MYLYYGLVNNGLILVIYRYCW